MKKQLLNETEIRKMMKFANIGPLSPGFVDRLNESAMVEADGLPGEEDEEDEEAAGGMTSPDAEMSMDPDDMGGEEDEMSMEPEPDMGGEGGDVVSQALTKIGDSVRATQEAFRLLGEPGVAIANAMSVEDGGAADDEPMGEPMDEPMGDPMGEPDADAAALPDVDVVDDEEEDVGPSPDGVMEEVARRVAKRLRNMKRQDRF